MNLQINIRKILLYSGLLPPNSYNMQREDMISQERASLHSVPVILFHFYLSPHFMLYDYAREQNPGSM